MQFNRRNLYLMGWLTILGIGGLGISLIGIFRPDDLNALFQTGNIGLQAEKGLLFGISAAMVALWLTFHPILDDVRIFFGNLIGGIGIRFTDIIFISLCAGIGEEILFRGFIQTYLGIWPTAIIFVAIHGYLNPNNWKVSVYGVLMVIVSGGLGYLFGLYGFWSAAIAHALFDFILFSYFAISQRIKKS